MVRNFNFKPCFGEFDDLQKTGWLPTAIVINILLPTDHHDGVKVAPNDLVELRTAKSGPSSLLPAGSHAKNWNRRC